MQTISLKLPEGLLEQLETAAREKRVTKSQVVRESLEKTLNQRTKGTTASCFDLARDLAGSLKGLPKYLATNPIHLDDFGR